MRIAMVSFTRRGAHVAQSLCAALCAGGHACTAYAMPRHAAQAGLLPLERPLSEWTKEAFSGADALVFISACGVAVRAVAPYVKSKAEDPAVVVLDDNARFAVSLLSGHLGGANALTQEVARLTGAQAVISTATDGAGLFSVDAWAARENCALWELSRAKAVSAALLDGAELGFCSDFPVSTPLPAGLLSQQEGALGIHISLDELAAPFGETLHLVPRVLVLGIGCKRGTAADVITRHVRQALSAHRLSPRAICAVASIDIKRDEAGLCAFCKEIGAPLHTYGADELSHAKGSFSASPFVQGVVGVDNVCERAAVLCAGEGARLVLQKQARNGVTVAAAVRGWEVRF